MSRHVYRVASVCLAVARRRRTQLVSVAVAWDETLLCDRNNRQLEPGVAADGDGCQLRLSSGATIELYGYHKQENKA
jgi:hypothetical protein